MDRGGDIYDDDDDDVGGRERMTMTKITKARKERKRIKKKMGEMSFEKNGFQGKHGVCHMITSSQSHDPTTGKKTETAIFLHFS